MALTQQGLSDALYSQLESAFGKIPKVGRRSLRKFTDAMAEAFVAYLTANVQVNVAVTTTTTITTSDAGLQREPVTPFADTLAPSTNKTLSGTGTGTGTIS